MRKTVVVRDDEGWLLNIDDDLDKDGDCVDEVATGDKSDGAWPAEHRQSLDDNDDDDNDNDDDR